MSRRLFISLWALTLVAGLALSAANLYFGELNQDEGWYLYAAGLVGQGQRPFVDFVHTQGPVMPFVYAVARPLVHRWGLAGGRLFTVLLAWAGAGLAARLAARLAPPGAGRTAALLACMLITLNVYQSYFCAIVKTYALTGLWLVAGFTLLESALARRRTAGAVCAGALFALAAGTRTSAGAVWPAVFAVLGWRCAGPRGRDGQAGRGAICAGQLAGLAWGAAATGLLLLVPFWRQAPAALWFGLVEYHAGRSPGGLFPAVAYKGGFVIRMAQAYLVAIVLLGGAVLRRWLAPRAAASAADAGGEEARGGLPLGALWASVAAVTAVHFCAPFPYDDYQVLIYPVLAVAVAVRLARGAPAGARGAQGGSGPWHAWLLALCFLFSAAAAVSAPMVQEWFVGPRDRIWWPLKKEPPLVTLQRTARRLRDELGLRRGDLLLTQDTYLAVEAGLRVPEGLELGPFSYFPDWSLEKARRCRVVNREQLTELLATCPAGVAAFSGYGLSIRSPEIVPLCAAEEQALWAIVKRRYRPYAEVEPFGQAGTRLSILRRP